jgi:methylated-DNA-[protein]-cysteine S-methyltransferase
MKYYDFYESTLGRLGICEEDGKILQIWFDEREGKDRPSEGEVRETPVIAEAKRQLEEYFQGSRRQFELPLAPEGTEFQKKVWEALQDIPYGETRSYKQVAEAVGNGKACRAVGMANNRNPIPIVIPCHRVVGSDQSLVGYGGGLDLKMSLLAMEALEKS